MEDHATDDVVIAGIIVPRSFADRVILPDDPYTECWEWDGRHDKGRPRYWDKTNGRHVHAYNFAYEALYHAPIPDGEVGRHMCNHEWCASPYHIRRGTQQRNMQDAAAHGRIGGFVAQWREGRAQQQLDDRLAYLLAAVNQ